MMSSQTPENSQQNDSSPVPIMDRARKSMIPVPIPNHVKNYIVPVPTMYKSPIPGDRKSMIPIISPNYFRDTKYFLHIEDSFPVDLQYANIGLYKFVFECITPKTMYRVLAGDYLHLNINSARIIDCRYPYEYEGGHIQSATNLYLKQQLLSFFQDFVVENTNEMISKEIIVFHCEFSSKRGPRMMAFWNELRKEFEAVHGSNRVQFPEAYLLYGGYKLFFSTFPQACTPSGYVEMIDSRHYKECYNYYNECKGENDLLIVQKNGNYLN